MTRKRRCAAAPRGGKVGRLAATSNDGWQLYLPSQRPAIASIPRDRFTPSIALRYRLQSAQSPQGVRFGPVTIDYRRSIHVGQRRSSRS